MVKTNTHRKISWGGETLAVATGLSEDEILWPNGMDTLLADENPDPNEPRFLYRTVSNLLDQLTWKNFEKRLNRIENLPIETKRRMRGVVDVILRKAMENSNKCELYAQVCKYMTKFHVVKYNEDEELYFLKFQSVLYLKCRTILDNFRKKEKRVSFSNWEDRGKIDPRFIAFSRFLSELCRLKMFTYNFIYHIIMKLLNFRKRVLTESVCKLLAVVGKRLVLKLEEDGQSRKLFLLFDQLQRLFQKIRNISPKLISVVGNLINFRKDYWLLYKKADDEFVTSKSKKKTKRRPNLKNSIPTSEIQKIDYIHSLKSYAAIKSFKRLRYFFDNRWEIGKNSIPRFKRLPEAISELIRFVILRRGKCKEYGKWDSFLIHSISCNLFSTVDLVEGFYHFSIKAELRNEYITRKNLEYILDPFFKRGYFQQSIHSMLAHFTPNNVKASEFERKIKIILFLQPESFEFVVLRLIDKVIINPHWYHFYVMLCCRLAKFAAKNEEYSVMLMEACDAIFDQKFSTIDKSRMIGFCRFFSLLVNKLNDRTAHESAQNRMIKLLDTFQIELFCEVYNHLRWKEALFQDSSLFDSRIPVLLSNDGLEFELQKMLRKVAKNYASKKKEEKRKLKNIRLISSTTQKPVLIESRIVNTQVNPRISYAEVMKLSVEELRATVTDILNKSTSKGFDPVVEKIMKLPIDNVPRLQLVADLIFDKAIDEPDLCRWCAKICRSMQHISVPEAVGNKMQTFGILLINKCHQEFESNRIKELNMMKKRKDIQLSKKNRKTKKIFPQSFLAIEYGIERKLVGNCQFIAELFNLQILPATVVFDCITKLLESLSELFLNCLGKLLSTTKKNLKSKLTSTEKEKIIKMYYDKIGSIWKNEPKLCKKTRSMLQGVIDYLT